MICEQYDYLLVSREDLEPLLGHPRRWAMRYLNRLALRDALSIEAHNRNVRNLGQAVVTVAAHLRTQEYVKNRQDEAINAVHNSLNVRAMPGKSLVPPVSSIEIPTEIYDGLLPPQPYVRLIPIKPDQNVHEEAS